MTLKLNYKKGYIPSLDGIRGLAILLVVTFHCLGGLTYPINFISKIGWVGVDLFFVLSGFLITGILIDDKEKGQNIFTFYGKRVLRIFPLYYFSILLFLLLFYGPAWFNRPPLLDVTKHESIIYYLTYTQNWYYSIFGWGKAEVLNHLWSLAIEEHFYLFWPLVIYFTRRKSLLWICIVIILLSIGLRNYNPEIPFSYVFTFCRLDALAMGSITAILIRDKPTFLERFTLPIFFISSFWLLGIIFTTQNVSLSNPHFIRFGYTLFAVAFSSLLILVFDQRFSGIVINHIFKQKWLCFLGKYSYGIYVYHWFFYRGIYVSFEKKYALGIPHAFLFLGLILIISLISYHGMEKHFLRLKSKLS